MARELCRFASDVLSQGFVGYCRSSRSRRTTRTCRSNCTCRTARACRVCRVCRRSFYHRGTARTARASRVCRRCLYCRGPCRPQGPQRPAGPAGPTSAASTVVGPQGPQGPQGPPGPAGTGTGTTWANIDRAMWTSFIGCGNTCPYMAPQSPFVTNNLVLNESLMPGANKNYNLGQDQRRYFNVFADRFICRNIIHGQLLRA